MRWIADIDEIRKGKTTDIYFWRTREILRSLRKDPIVVAEFTAKDLPYGYDWAIFTGLVEVIELLEGLKIDLYALPEGALFYRNEPVMMIEGRYSEFGILETAILGLICQASGVATKAARCRVAGPGKLLLSFGARRMHPALSPMIERNAYLGGCDGVSTILAAERLKISPSGTIPHTLILITGSLSEAMKAFDRNIKKGVKRIALIDTFGDEKFEAIQAAEALGKKLYGVRLDTPHSRRGDLLSIIKEVRWELDIRGYNHVRIFASGGIDEDSIRELNEVCDGYGIGTILSNARVIDYAMDIVEINNRLVAKRGKRSGKKGLYYCRICGMSKVAPFGRTPKCYCGRKMVQLLRQYLKTGKKTFKRYPSDKKIKTFVASELAGRLKRTKNLSATGRLVCHSEFISE